MERIKIQLASSLIVFCIAFFARPTTCARWLASSDGTVDHLVIETCKKTQYCDVCLASLGSDPRSRGADLQRLAWISVDVSIGHASDTIARIGTMKDEGGSSNDSYINQCLSDCLKEYSDAVDNLRQSSTALSEQSYMDANEFVSAAMTDSDTCEDAFGEKPGYESPLTERNVYFAKLCSNSLAIAKLLRP